jgi:large subunit ribosomal protein L5
MNRTCTPACLSGCSRAAFRTGGDRIGRRFLNTSKLTPIQPPPVTSPSSPHFVPKKMGQRTRLSAYYDDLIAPDYLLMNFDATMKHKQQLLPLRWDGTSPYHKNRKIPRQPPLPRLRQPVDAKNIPMVKGITVHTMVKSALIKRPDLLSAALVVQSLTGKRPEFIYSIHSVAAFKLRPRMPSHFYMLIE